jgi:hypothetical protein
MFKVVGGSSLNLGELGQPALFYLRFGITDTFGWVRSITAIVLHTKQINICQYKRKKIIKY